MLVSVESVAVVSKSVFMAVLTREHTRTARPRNGICHIAVGKNKPFPCNIVNVGCGDSIPVGIGTDSLPGMIVGHDVDDVERFSVFNTLFLSGAGSEEEAGGECCKCAIG